ncbi:MAG: hypothetical protein ACUVYA_13155 [Planctomycetota bacterium]
MAEVLVVPKPESVPELFARHLSAKHQGQSDVGGPAAKARYHAWRY